MDFKSWSEILTVLWVDDVVDGRDVGAGAGAGIGGLTTTGNGGAGVLQLSVMSPHL